MGDTETVEKEEKRINRKRSEVIIIVKSKNLVEEKPDLGMLLQMSEPRGLGREWRTSN